MGKYLAVVERLTAADEGDPGELKTGAAFTVWLPAELVAELTELASELGVSRSTIARELLTVAVPEAMEDAQEAVRAQLGLPGIAPRQPREIRILKPKRPAKGPVKAPKRRSRR